MKKSVNFFLYSVLSLWIADTDQVQAEQIFKTTDNSVIGYLEYLPPDYHLNSDRYPVVIFLHGIGERGYNSTDPLVLSQSIQRVARNGPPMFVASGTQFPFILISPQLKDNYGNWPSEYVMEVINYVKTYLRIDEKRIYLTGLSLGGGGVWWTAQDHPELFAAVAPVCGGRNSPSLACRIAAENLPVWAFHGDMDSVVPLSKSVNMVNAINACIPKVNPEARLTVYAGVAHDSWTNAYRIDNMLHSPNVYDWMLSFRNTINGGNILPTADAGLDKTVYGKTASISGTASDPEGSIASYLWTQLSGPNVATLTNQFTQTLNASALIQGEYVFGFRTTDAAGGSDIDFIKIAIDTSNQLPVANAGTDKSLYLPANATIFSGTATDTDGVVSGFAWTKISGPAATLTGEATNNLSASGLVMGTYVFRLIVTDDKGGKSDDEISLFVKDPVAPIANAGPNKTVVLPSSSVSIAGSATDIDGSISTYQWTKKSGNACSLSGTTGATLNVSSLTLGSYVFRLSVTDNLGLTAYDEVRVNVTWPPLVDAGFDKSVDLPLTSFTLTGTASDPDGIIKSYAWSKYSGPYALLSNKNTPSLTISGLKEGTYVFALKAVDNFYASATDYVTLTVKSTTLSTISTALVNSKIIVDNSHSEGVVDGIATPQTILGNKSTMDLENCMVAIFNRSGNRLFSGVWSMDRYNEVFTESGYYIYNIMKGGKRVESGKIYVTH
ncbi:MAG: prolyl oligopeptidase family serine peptidase [Cyclobacteriaceae bacterium]